jgi:hypothetical protein
MFLGQHQQMVEKQLLIIAGHLTMEKQGIHHQLQ